MAKLFEAGGQIHIDASAIPQEVVAAVNEVQKTLDNNQPTMTIAVDFTGMSKEDIKESADFYKKQITEINNLSKTLKSKSKSGLTPKEILREYLDNASYNYNQLEHKGKEDAQRYLMAFQAAVSHGLPANKSGRENFALYESLSNIAGYLDPKDILPFKEQLAKATVLVDTMENKLSNMAQEIKNSANIGADAFEEAEHRKQQAVQDTTKTTKEELKKQEELFQKSVQKVKSTIEGYIDGSEDAPRDVMYHRRNTPLNPESRKAESLDRLGDAISWEYGGQGSGYYLQSNLSETGDAEHYYAINMKAIRESSKLLELTMEDQATEALTFFNLLQRYCVSLGGFEGYSEDLQGVNPKILYNHFENFFKEINMTYNEFLSFIDEMKIVAKNAGDLEVLNELGDFKFKDPSGVTQADSYTTRLLKSKGYEGVYFDPKSGYNNESQGSVIYDIQKILDNLVEFKDRGDLEFFDTKLLMEGVSVFEEYKQKAIEAKEATDNLGVSVDEVSKKSTNKSTQSFDNLQSSAEDAKNSVDDLGQTIDTLNQKSISMMSLEDVEKQLEDNVHKVEELENALIPLKANAQLMSQFGGDIASMANEKFVDAKTQLNNLIKENELLLQRKALLLANAVAQEEALAGNKTEVLSGTDNAPVLQKEEDQVEELIGDYEKLLDLKNKIKNVDKSDYSGKHNTDWIGIYASQEEAVAADLADNKSKLHSSLNLILNEDKKALGALEEEANRLKTALQPIQDMVSRISSNSSITDLDDHSKGSKEWYKGYAEAYQAIDDRLGELQKQYNLTNEELEEYITLQVKAEKIIDRMVDHNGGVQGSGAKNKTELKLWIEKSFASDLGIDPEEIYNGLFGNITDAIYGGGTGISLFDAEGTKRNLREISAELLNYSSEFSGAYGADEDAKRLREINAVLSYIKNNAEEISSTDFSVQIQKATQDVEYFSQRLAEGEHTEFYADTLEDAKKDLQELIALQERLNTSLGIAPEVNQTPLSSDEAKEADKIVEVNKELEESYEKVAQAKRKVASKDNVPKLADKSVEKSVPALTEEAVVTEKIADTMSEAASAKESFAKANQKVENSAEESASALSEEANKVQEVTNAVNENTKAQEKNSKAKKKSKEVVTNPSQEGFNPQKGWVKDVDKAWNQAVRENDQRTGKALLNSYTNIFQALSSEDGKIDAYQSQLKELGRILEQLDELVPIKITSQSEKDKLAELDNQAKELVKDLRDVKYNLAEQVDIDKLSGQISNVLLKNTAMPKELRTSFEGLREQLRKTGLSAVEVDKIKEAFISLKAQMFETGKVGASTGDKIKKKFGDVAAYFATYVSIYDFINMVRQGYQYVAELDKQMIELEKVSDMSGARLEQSFEHATNAAKDLGATISDVISATADWSRLGYGADEAEELAEVAILYKNVGDGIDIDTANNSLISTLQGFQMEASEAMDIVDAFNEVANRMPIDSAGIGEALQRSAAAFNAANTDLNESIALITATNAVVQDPTRVGNMWKTVSMRIRGAKVELEEAGLETDGMVESTSQLRDLIKSMTGFDIMVDDSTYKDIKEIVVGIGKEWKNLSDIDQAALLEKLAGKTQGNALAAALNNYEMIEEAYAIAEESSGSAMREQEKWEQGLEARTNKLKASLEELSATVLDSDFLGGAIDAGRTFIEVLTGIIDKVGVIPTLLGSAGAIFGVKSAISGGGRVKKFTLRVYEYATGEFNSDVYELCVA